MKFKKCVSLLISILFIFTTISNSFAMNPSDIYDFDAIVNKNRIEKYGEWQDNYPFDYVMDNRMLFENKIREEVNIVAKKIASGEIVLDKTPTSDITTAFLKKIYNGGFFLKKEYESIYGIVNMAEIDIIMYMINHDERIKEWATKIDSIKDEAIEAAKFYIDSMPLSDLAKTKMKETIDNTKIEIYGFNNGIDLYSIFDCEYIKKNMQIYIDYIENSSFCDVFTILKNPEDVQDIICNGNLFDFNTHSSGAEEIITVSAMAFLFPLYYSIDESASALKETLAHELGHIWNNAYVLENSKSMVYHMVTLLDNEEFENASKNFYNNNNKIDHLQYLTADDKKFLSENAKKIVDAFNVRNIDYINERDYRYIQFMKRGDMIIEEITAECDKILKDKKLELYIDGMFVFCEAAADNFGLEAITRYEKSKGNDVYKVFSAFAKEYWGLNSKSGLAEYIPCWYAEPYPQSKYRINIGLSLCEAYKDWLKENNL